MIKATYIDHMGTDLTTVNAARVSFGKKSEWVEVTEVNHHREEWGHGRYDEEIFYYKLSDADTKLIHYLASGMSSKDLEKWKNQMITANDPDTVMEAYEALAQAQPHMSPFGHAFASFHVKAPIFVARQLVKHKFLRWNEISRRYVDDEPEFYVPEVWRGRSKDKKQGSDGVVKPYQGSYIFNSGSDPFTRSAGWMASGKGTSAIALQTYKALLAEGVAPEQARMVLPQSTMTEWYWSGSLDAFADMCRLRCKDDTQYETRLVADQISVIMKDLFPVSWDALTKENDK
jgi:thymidylate synthase (FAD)